MQKQSGRIFGLDLARSIAILGMILVNYYIILGGDDSTLSSLFHAIEGKAAATFVVLAGTGISLMNKSRIQRSTVVKRAIFLLVFGLLYSPIWPADILHFYGVYLLISALFLTASDAVILSLAATVPFIFVVLILIIDYNTGWNFNTLEYTDFWTAEGMIRHLFYNGFHPVFPWIAFLFIGMWLGHQDIRAIRGKVAALGGIMLGCSQLLSSLLTRMLPWAESELIFGTQPLPPFPLFILAGTGTALLIISACVELTERFVPTWLVETGQLSLTNYVSHIIIGIGLLEVFSVRKASNVFIFFYSIGFFILSVIFSHYWSTRYKRGPLESLMRMLTG